jgi:hypothetical protein
MGQTGASTWKLCQKLYHLFAFPSLAGMALRLAGWGLHEGLRIAKRTIHIVDLRLGDMVGGLAEHRVQKVDGTKSARDQREHRASVDHKLGGNACMGEDAAEPEIAQNQFNVVC